MFAIRVIYTSIIFFPFLFCVGFTYLYPRPDAPRGGSTIYGSSSSDSPWVFCVFAILSVYSAYFLFLSFAAFTADKGLRPRLGRGRFDLSDDGDGGGDGDDVANGAE